MGDWSHGKDGDAAPKSAAHLHPALWRDAAGFLMHVPHQAWDPYDTSNYTVPISAASLL